MDVIRLMDIKAMWKSAIWSCLPAVGFLVLVSGHGVVHADQEAAPVAKVDEQSEAEPRSPRLKYRSRGPACMCLSGLSEAEIQAAQRRREEGTEKLESIIPDQ
jgi:hypothetical protein